MVRAEGVNWGRIPPERRGRWGRWLYLQRWNAGRQTQDSVRATLEKIGHPISVAYYSEMESGKTIPNEEWQTVFVRLWGSPPEAEPEQPEVASDTAALIAAMTAQTEAITALVGELRLMVNRGQHLSPEGVRSFLETLIAEGLIARPEGFASIDEPQPQSAGR